MPEQSWTWPESGRYALQSEAKRGIKAIPKTVKHGLETRAIVAGRCRGVCDFAFRYSGRRDATSNDPARISLEPANQRVGVARDPIAGSPALAAVTQGVTGGRQVAGSRYLLAGLRERSACGL